MTNFVIILLNKTLQIDKQYFSFQMFMAKLFLVPHLADEEIISASNFCTP